MRGAARWGAQGAPTRIRIGRPRGGDGRRALVERLTLAAGDITFRDVRLDGARLHGVAHELAHFADGYRGASPYGYLFLSEHSPGLVSGVIGNGALTTFDYETGP